MITKLAISSYKCLIKHRNWGLKETGDFNAKLPSASPNILSALLRAAPRSLLFCVLLCNCGLILEEKSRAFINDISSMQGLWLHITNGSEYWGRVTMCIRRTECWPCPWRWVLYLYLLYCFLFRNIGIKYKKKYIDFDCEVWKYLCNYR